jgi:hypothetical protein
MSFVREFNAERPHEALDAKRPAEPYYLGYFDLEQKTLQPLDNPFGMRLSPMSYAPGVTYVSGPAGHKWNWRSERFELLY